MTNTIGLLIILVILGVVNLGATAAVFMFMMTRFDLLDGTRKLRESNIQPTVTRTGQAFVNENHALKEESAIVEPKTPQRIAWEEQEELRKMQLGQK